MSEQPIEAHPDSEALKKKYSMKKSGWIATYTGRQFWPLEPDAVDVDIRDIAHALSLMCRFNGHCRSFYSVAQHSVLCSEYTAAFGASAQVQMGALLHDATEAYLPDITSPIKGAMWVSSGAALKKFSAVEAQLLQVIAAGLEQDPSQWADPLIGEADQVMAMTEKRDVMTPSPHEWSFKAACWNTIIPLSPSAAEGMFLMRYRRMRALIIEQRNKLEHIEHRTIGSDPEPAGGAK